MGMNPRLLRPTASGFRPSQISGLSAWYDASVASSLTLVSGFVSQWSDLSGGGLHLTQSGASNRPGTTTINGRTAIDFDGSNDYLFTTTAPTASGTVFCVHVLDGTSANTLYHLQSGTGGTATRMHLLYSSLNEYRSQSVASGGVNTGISGGVRTASTRVATHTFSGTQATVSIDAASLTGTALSNGSDQEGFWLGIRNIGGALTLPLDGKICEVVTYNRVLSATEITRVERYLAAKWGVTLYSPPTYADADVNAYITAVELADGGLMLEPGVRDAINDFITGCKSDGIWSAIKASCILMGARTLAGALTPLVGTAPTNNGPFVSGDYSRKTGLAGNGTSKYLDTNRNCNADPQNNFHFAVYLSENTSSGNVTFGAGGASTGATQVSTALYRCRSGTSDTPTVAMGTAGLHGMSRSASGQYVGRASGASQTFTRNSETPFNGNLLTHARFSGGSAGLFVNMRINFYSVGESLDLALLDSRVGALSTAIGAAI